MIDDDDGFHPEPIEGVFTDLSRAEMIPPQWIIEGLIPVGLNFWAGPPKSLKSTLLLAAGLTVTGVPHKALPEGMNRLIGPVSSVMAFSAEAKAGELKDIAARGLRAKLPEDSHLYVAEDPWLFRLDEENGLKKLFFWLDELKPRLWWMDPFPDFHEADENSPLEMLRILRPVQKYCVERNIAGVLVQHTRKKGAGGYGQQDEGGYKAADMRGSGAIFGKSDGVLVLTPKGEAGLIEMEATFKRAKGWTRVVQLPVWDGEKEARERLDDESRAVYQLFLKNGEQITLQDIAEQLHFGKKLVVECFEKLARVGMVKKDGKRWKIQKKSK